MKSCLLLDYGIAAVQITLPPELERTLDAKTVGADALEPDSAVLEAFVTEAGRTQARQFRI